MIDLGSARGARGPKAKGKVEVEFVRELQESDLEGLQKSGVPAPQGQGLIAQLRYSHHQLAMLLARGASDVEASQITGYSPSWISSIKGDPAFRELLAYYGAQRELVNLDVLERMKALGMNSLEELQDRLESNPESFAPRELMELTELMLIKGRAAPGSRQGAGPQAAGGGGGVVVNVKFVSPSGPIVDGRIEDV